MYYFVRKHVYIYRGFKLYPVIQHIMYNMKVINGYDKLGEPTPAKSPFKYLIIYCFSHLDYFPISVKAYLTPKYWVWGCFQDLRNEALCPKWRTTEWGECAERGVKKHFSIMFIEREFTKLQKETKSGTLLPWPSIKPKSYYKKGRFMGP